MSSVAGAANETAAPNGLSSAALRALSTPPPDLHHLYHSLSFARRVLHLRRIYRSSAFHSAARSPPHERELRRSLLLPAPLNPTTSLSRSLSTRAATHSGRPSAPFEPRHDLLPVARTYYTTASTHTPRFSVSVGPRCKPSLVFPHHADCNTSHLLTAARQHWTSTSRLFASFGGNFTTKDGPLSRQLALPFQTALLLCNRIICTFTARRLL